MFVIIKMHCFEDGGEKVHLRLNQNVKNCTVNTVTYAIDRKYRMRKKIKSFNK